MQLLFPNLLGKKLINIHSIIRVRAREIRTILHLPVRQLLMYIFMGITYINTECVLAQSVERPPHNREVVGSIPGRVIPKDVKRWELLLPCLALNIWKG